MREVTFKFKGLNMGQASGVQQSIEVPLLSEEEVHIAREKIKHKELNSPQELLRYLYKKLGSPLSKLVTKTGIKQNRIRDIVGGDYHPIGSEYITLLEGFGFSSRTKVGWQKDFFLDVIGFYLDQQDEKSFAELLTLKQEYETGWLSERLQQIKLPSKILKYLYERSGHSLKKLSEKTEIKERRINTIVNAGFCHTCSEYILLLQGFGFSSRAKEGWQKGIFLDAIGLYLDQQDEKSFTEFLTLKQEYETGWLVERLHKMQHPSKILKYLYKRSGHSLKELVKKTEIKEIRIKNIVSLKIGVTGSEYITLLEGLGFSSRGEEEWQKDFFLEAIGVYLDQQDAKSFTAFLTLKQEYETGWLAERLQQIKLPSKILKYLYKRSGHSLKEIVKKTEIKEIRIRDIVGGGYHPTGSEYITLLEGLGFSPEAEEEWQKGIFLDAIGMYLDQQEDKSFTKLLTLKQEYETGWLSERLQQMKLPQEIFKYLYEQLGSPYKELSEKNRDTEKSD